MSTLGLSYDDPLWLRCEFSFTYLLYCSRIVSANRVFSKNVNVVTVNIVTLNAVTLKHAW